MMLKNTNMLNQEGKKAVVPKLRITKKNEPMANHGINAMYYDLIKENKRTNSWSLTLPDIPFNKIFIFCDLYEKILEKKDGFNEFYLLYDRCTRCLADFQNGDDMIYTIVDEIPLKLCGKCASIIQKVVPLKFFVDNE